MSEEIQNKFASLGEQGVGQDQGIKYWGPKENLQLSSTSEEPVVENKMDFLKNSSYPTNHQISPNSSNNSICSSTYGGYFRDDQINDYKVTYLHDDNRNNNNTLVSPLT